MTALECISREIIKIQQAEAECIDQYGIVKSSHKHRYQELVRKAQEFKASKDWLESQRIGTPAEKEMVR